MKKSIKYAGIAAATLLAVAPVAAPVVSQAATNVTSTETDFTQSDNQAKNFKNQFGDIDNSQAVRTAVTQAGEYFGSENAQSISDFQANAAVASLFKSQTANLDLTLLSQKNTKVYITATDKAGKTYDNNGTTVGTSAADLAQAMQLDSKLPVTMTIHLTGNNLDSTVAKENQTITFNINNTSSNELKTINAQYTTPITVAKNSKILATQLVNTNDVTLTDQDGKSAAVKTIAYGVNYYSTYSDAITAAKNGEQAPTDSNNQLNGDIKDGEFKTAGTYYQTVTYTAQDKSSLAKFLMNYTSQNTVDPDLTVYVNGKKASAGYDFAAKADGINQSITFVRAINVSNDTSDWTTTDTTGVVTTKSDSSFYTLKNGINVTISNRALAKNTAWKTNAVRTDQNGNKQYRVGADEWINASDVTFSDKENGGNGSTTGAYTDVKALNGKVTTAGPSGYYYPLYNDNGELISNRGVAGLTSWYTDKSAKNADGTTVYHVATGEWLQGTNVNYQAY